jgi:hypothetical protein
MSVISGVGVKLTPTPLLVFFAFMLLDKQKKTPPKRGSLWKCDPSDGHHSPYFAGAAGACWGIGAGAP